MMCRWRTRGGGHHHLLWCVSSHEERIRAFKPYIQLGQRPSAGDHHDLVCSNGHFQFNQFTAGLELWKAQAHHVEPSRFGSGYSAFGESTIPADQRLVAVADLQKSGLRQFNRAHASQIRFLLDRQDTPSFIQ
jgi:hypothetical protein